jgi:hypothetical protein
VEEHLPFDVEHDLRGPQAGHAAEHTQEDIVGLLPIMIGANLWGRHTLS